MSWTHLILRRTHLYLGLVLIPWVMIYAVSSFIINHGSWFRSSERADAPKWTVLWSKPYRLDLPPRTTPEQLRLFGERLLKSEGLSGAFWISRQGNRLNIHLPRFWKPVRLTYDLRVGRLTAEQQHFAWPDLFVRMHVRGGYQQSGFFDDAWAVWVDLTCLAILLWVVSGIYLWWKIPSTRFWGTVTFLAGCAVFLVLVLAL